MDIPILTSGAPCAAPRGNQTTPKKRPQADEVEDYDSSDADLSPLERTLAQNSDQPAKKKAKKDTETTPTKEPNSTVVASIGDDNLKNLPSHVMQLLGDSKAGLKQFMEAPTIPDINVDNLASVTGRLQSKKRGLGKKSGTPGVEDSLRHSRSRGFAEGD